MKKEEFEGIKKIIDSLDKNDYDSLDIDDFDNDIRINIWLKKKENKKK